MFERSAALLIDDILEAASKIASYTAGMTREDFVSSGMAADAVVRNLEIVTIQQHRICVVINLLMGTSTLRRLLPSSYGTAG